MKNELQGQLREQLPLQSREIESSEFECGDEREIKALATPSGVNINSLLAAMMDKMQVANQMLLLRSYLLEASRAVNQKLLADVREASKSQKARKEQIAI